MKFSIDIINKVDVDDTTMATIDAIENAYVLGMLYAMQFTKEQDMK